MAVSLYLKAEGRKALRYNVNILNLWPPAAQWNCHNERRAPFWLSLPAILTLPPSMQAAEAFGLADTEAEAFGLADTETACTRDGHKKMPTSLQAPHSETQNSPALFCFFVFLSQQVPGKWPSAPFRLALHLQLTALVTWDHVHETKLLFIIYPHLLAQTLTSDMGDTHLLGYWNSQIFPHRVIWWWLTFQTSSQMCTQKTIRSKHMKPESSMDTTRNESDY